MMPVPYYQDSHVMLYHGDSVEILPTLNVEARALLTDPPYFKVKPDAWDNQWGKADEFLSWMSSWLKLCRPLVSANGSVWVFASPAMVSSVERVVGAEFRVLNSIRWVKDAGWHRKAQVESLRSFLSPWEGIVLAEQFADEYDDMAKALHKQVFAPLGRYIQAERERAGVGRKVLAAGLSGYKNLDSANANIFNWELGKNLISELDYLDARKVLNAQGGDHLSREYEDLRREYEDLRREYEDLRREYEDLRRPFNIQDRSLSTDIWNFPTVAPYPGKHPCEKPLPMLAHMIDVSTRHGDIVLDPFAGSGSTLEAARNLGRRAIGIEKDEAYCEKIVERLTREAEHPTLDFTA